MKELPKEAVPTLVCRPNYRVDVILADVPRFIADYLDSGLQMDPDFQRGHVWNQVQRERWIEYLLRGGRAYNDILMNQPGWQENYEGDFVLVDGKQRLTAILDFLSDKLPVFRGLHGAPEGWLASQIPREVKRKVSIGISVNNLKSRNDLLRWYLELNEGAVAHTEEELARVRALME